MRQQINKGRTSYQPNSLGGGCPFQAGRLQGGFTSFPERIDAKKIRGRSKSFFDHFSQAKLFYQSQSVPEKNHIVAALSFELGKCESVEIRGRMVGILSLVDKDLAEQVGQNLGLKVSEPTKPLNHIRPADVAAEDYEPVQKESSIQSSAALSMANTLKNSIKGRMIAFLAADGVNAHSVKVVEKALTEEGATVHVIAGKLGSLTAEDNSLVPVSKSFLTAASVLYDAVYVPAGAKSVATLAADPDALHFLNEAYRHCKAIAAHGDAERVFKGTYFGHKFSALSQKPEQVETQSLGLFAHSDLKLIAELFVKSVKQHRFWERETTRNVPA